jgi:hypothetical protein
VWSTHGRKRNAYKIKVRETEGKRLLEETWAESGE